jgi:hypothetical protein
VTFSGRSVDGSPLQIPGFAGVSRDGTVTAAFSSGPDESSRDVILSGGDLELLEEALGLIDFTGVSVDPTP